MNVSEFDDVTEATDTLISALQAFKNESTDVGTYSMQIIDEMNEVGNAYAISTSDLANSLTRSSAALAAANNSLEESIAMTTAANTIIQDPEAVGNALKVVSMRIRGVKTELEAAGEDTEGMVTNTAKLQKQIMALTSIDGDGGVNILADNGSFKSTYQILLEISKVWEKIDDSSQAGLLEVLAGKVRGSTVAALLSGGDIMEAAYKSASGAKGSAQEELDKYLDSIDGKITQFNNSLQTMWMNLLDSEVIKNVVDFGTGVIKFLDTVPGKITAIIAALAGFAKFKGFSVLGLGKDAGKSLQNYASALSKLNSLKSIGANIGSDDTYNTSAVTAYANAVDGLAAKKQAELLATVGLDKAQIREVMRRNQVGDAVIDETLSKMGLMNTTKELHTATVREVITTQLSVDAMQDKVVADFLAANGSKKLTKELLAQMVQQKILTVEQAAGVLANNKLAFSWKALGQSIKMAFLSNPVGWLMTLATTVIPLVVTGINAITQSTEEAAAAAREASEVSEELRQKNNSLEDYKDQIRELRTELNNNTLSEQEAYDAREKLLTIQDELIDKFGFEKDGINLVTGAINEQIAAIDKLQQKESQQWINNSQKQINNAIKYFDSDTKGGKLDSFWEAYSTNITNWAPTKNVRDMINQYANNPEHDNISTLNPVLTGAQEINFNGSVKDVKKEVEEFQNWLGEKQKELTQEKIRLLSLPDQTDDVKAQIVSVEKDIEQLKHVYEDIGAEHENWFGKNSIYAANKKVLEETQYNTALTEYATQYGNILQAQKDLAEAQAKGDQEGIAAAIETINSETEAAASTARTNGQNYMVEFFQGIKDGYATQTKDIEISLNLSTEDGKNALYDALAGFDGKNAKEILQAYEIEPDGDAFVKLKSMADSYEISVQELIGSLVRLGYIQGDFNNNVPEVTSVVSSIDTLTSAVEKYKTALETVNSIAFDGQAISKDYYDALKEQLADITVGTEEFSDAIKEQNGKYIVKNVTLLKKLVNQSKKARKATIEVARSQAQLQYRDVVDQMRNAVLTMGIEYDAYNLITDATFDNISAMREQIDTLKQTIQQYALLEIGLSDAASAYDEYEAAKERDAQLSYDESFSEMLKTIDEGLLKNETGSEAFEYSVRAVVPEVIWSGIEDPNEKVKAIHDYIDGDKTFSKLFHVDEESGELDVNTDNVREFIKLSKEAGMIVGGPEGFELDNTVYGTKEWAEALNITEAAVLALLSATEDCDALWGNILTDLMTHPLDREINKSVDEVDEATKALEDYFKSVQSGDEEFKSDHYNELVSAVGAATDKLDENRQAAIDNAKAYNIVQSSISSFRGDLSLTDGEAANLVSSLKEIEGLEDLGEIAIQDGQLKLTDEQLTLILGKLGKITEPSVIQVQLRYDEISAEIDQINEYIKNKSTGSITIDGITFTNGADADGNAIEDYLAKLTAEQKEIQLTYSITETSTEEEKSVLESYQEMAKNGVQFTVTAIVDDAKEGLDSVADAQKNIKEKQTITFSTNASTIEQAIKDFADEYDRIASKVITLTVNVEKEEVASSVDPNPAKGLPLPGKGIGGQTKRVSRALGNARANGTPGLNTAEHDAIVGEIGPELVVDPIKGVYYTVGENGTEMVNLPKGAIIYNHKQTDELLRNGHTTRGRYTGGLSFARGNAYADYGIPSYHPNLNDETSFENGTDINTAWDDASSTLNSAANKISDAMSDAADSVGEFEETIDWIEIRMEEYDERIGMLSAKLENLTTAAEKNAMIDEIIAENKKKQADAEDGAKYYEEYAQQYLAGMNSTLVEAAKNGAIAITEFTKEQDEATVKAIQNYRDYAQKAADLYQQAEEIITEIADLAKQAFDNVANEFDNELSLNDSKLSRFESENSLLETDKGWASEDIYVNMQKENAAKIAILKQQRDALQAELDTGKIKKGTDAWYEAVNAIAEVDTEIVNLNIENENLQDSINDLNWEQFEFLITQFQAVSDEAENLLDILSTKDSVDEFGNWTDEGITSLGLLAQQMEVAEKQASKYEAAIEYLNKNWEKLGYTQEEYVERLEELKSGQYDAIKSYNDAKESIRDLNKARVDAIKDGIEKEIDAYEKLIKTKKEALDAEKDLHDFQKDVMDQQKNIADIERKLAALSGDNSASARAQRAKLEQELYEAKADLEETYYDRSVSNQQDALDKELESFQEQKEEEIEGWEKYLENLEVVVADSLTVVQENTSAVLATLTSMQDQYGLAITNSLLVPWQAGETAIQEYGVKLNVSLTALAAMFGLTVDEFAAKLGLTTEQLVSNLDITVAQMAANLGLTNEQLAAKLGLTVTDLNSKMDMTIQQLAANMGLTLPALAEKLGTTTAGLAGNLDMTMVQFAGKMGLTVEGLAGKFGLTAAGLAKQLGMTYQELMNPFGLSMSATVDALTALEQKYKAILDSIDAESKATVAEVNKAMDRYQTPQKTQDNTDKNEKPKQDKNNNTTGSKTEQEYYGVALAVWNGGYGWGTGSTRVKNLTAKGFDAKKVQEIVNKMGKDGYIHNGSWRGKYYGIKDLTPYHLNKFAKGTNSTNKDQWAIIDELGDELQLIPGKNGRLEYIKKGTGIIPADLTQRLVDMAMDPQDMLDRNRPAISAPHIINNEINIDCSVGTMVNIEHCDQSTLPDVEKLVNKAFDKHMQTLNNAIRSKVR